VLLLVSGLYKTQRDIILKKLFDYTASQNEEQNPDFHRHKGVTSCVWTVDDRIEPDGQYI
jgi:hypothetical protein